MKALHYKSVSPYWLVDELKLGKEIYVLDKDTLTVALLNEMTTSRAIAIINSAERDKCGRYEFWYKENEEELAND